MGFEYEDREELRREVAGAINWLARRWAGREEGAWGELLDQSLFLAGEHAKFFADPSGFNREHHLLYALRNILNLTVAALERLKDLPCDR